MSRAQWLEAARLYGAEFDYDEEIRRSVRDYNSYSKLDQFMAEQGDAAMLMLAASKKSIFLTEREPDEYSPFLRQLIFDEDGFKITGEDISTWAGENVTILTPEKATEFIELDGTFELTTWQKLMDDLSMIHQAAF